MGTIHTVQTRVSIARARPRSKAWTNEFFDDHRKSAGELIGELERMLPDRIVGKEMSARSKLPFKVALLAGALAWRIHELARAALTAYDDRMHVAGILATRATMETMAVLGARHLVVTIYKGGDIDGLVDERLVKGNFLVKNPERLQPRCRSA